MKRKEPSGAKDTTDGISKETSKETFQKRIKLNGELRKRVPQRPATIPTDIYVSRKSAFGSQLSRGTKLLLEDGHQSITIHGLGAMIQKAIDLALTLEERLHGQVELKCSTDTVQLVDDVIPEDDDEDIATQIRQNSAVHIKVIAKGNLRVTAGPTPRNTKSVKIHSSRFSKGVTGK